MLLFHASTYYGKAQFIDLKIDVIKFNFVGLALESILVNILLLRIDVITMETIVKKTFNRSLLTVSEV